LPETKAVTGHRTPKGGLVVNNTVDLTIDAEAILEDE